MTEQTLNFRFISSGTVRDFLARNKLGKYNEEEQKRLAEAKQAEKEAEEKAAAIIHVGNRCEVRVPGAPVRRATVMYVGKLGVTCLSCMFQLITDSFYFSQSRL